MNIPRPPRAKFRARPLVVALALALACLWLAARTEVPRAKAQQVPLSLYKNFESPQVHPLALTPDGTRLLAVNSPNATLSVFQLTGGTPTLTAEIPVGLEPVSVAVRNDREAWVVNWLSDSVSVVDLASGNVTRTIDVGDEPTDVVFAGTGAQRAFVCVSGRSEVKVFDASAPEAAPQVVSVRGKQPRALARDATGARVFVSVFESGNQTAIISADTVRAGGGLPPPQPAMSGFLPAAPLTGLIVKWNGSSWSDERGDGRWTGFVPFRLADVDVAVINADAPAVAAEVRGVGTQVGNAVFDPSSERLLVLNVEALNLTRFEPNLRGRFLRTRLSKVGLASPSVSHADLNAHVNYDSPGSDAERSLSLAQPSDIARAADGTLYVAALGSARVGVLDSSGAVVARVGVGQGPTGLALDEARSRLYVLNRFEQTLSVVDTAARGETVRVAVGFNPEPPEVRQGRRFLYDASLSAHGDVSCASCHLNGHRDGLAWDLGDPQGQMQFVRNRGAFIGFVPVGSSSNFHPMKGPMTTQSLRGIAGTEPLHWRGDRANLAAFNPAFVSLLGSPRELTGAEMSAFDAFVRTLTYPPNPLQNLDRTMPTNSPAGGNAARGQQLFNTSFLDGGVLTCNQCHSSAAAGTNGFIIAANLLQEPQDVKVPQLRGLYQKTGMRRAPGEQLTGFGFIHDGSFDTMLNFLRAPVFTFANDNDRRDVAAFVLSFDSGLAPAVGLQATVHAGNKSAPAVVERLNLLVSQANLGNCELVARGIYKGAHRSFRYSNAAGAFESDRAGEPPVTRQELVAAVEPGGELTFTGVPLGAGRRFSVDRDLNGTLNGDETLTSVNLSGRVVDADGNGVAGVTLTLTGSQTAQTVSDAEGRFLFGQLSTAGTHTVTPSKAGTDFGPASRTFANPTWHQSAFFVAPAAANALDSARFFAAQHYRDFFGREADAPGLAFWSNQITECGADANCRLLRQINVSAAFFLSIEFQETGYLVHRLYRASYARTPRYAELMPDSQIIGSGVVVGEAGWQQRIEANTQSFLSAWVNRPAFRAAFDGHTSAQFVDALFRNANVTPSQAERDALVNGLNTGAETRATALRKAAEHEQFKRQEFRPAFVEMQYFGYLRRDFDEAGFQFWLQKLNNHNGDFVSAEMVKSFLDSGEYRGRFGK